MKTKFFLCIFTLAFATTATAMSKRYAYDCSIMVSTDDNRAHQSAFTYDRDANTVTIRPNNGSSGTNNVAWKFDTQHSYYFGNDKTWFVVEAEGVSTSTNKSVMWGCAGYWGAAPQTVKELENGHQLLLWNLKNRTVFNFSDIVLYTNNDICLGLTSLGTTATIHYVDFMSPADVTMRYPIMNKVMGCSTEELLNKRLNTTLTKRFSDAKKLMNGKNTEKANGFILSRFQATIDEYQQISASSDSSVSVVSLIAMIDEAIDDFLISYKTYPRNLPVVQTKFTADPAPFVVGDTLFLLTGHDHNDAYGFLMPDYLLYKTTDMVNWTDCGVVASLKNFKWADRYGWGGFSNGAWAPQVVQANNKFYMYCPLQGRGIGVLVATTPYGPWRDPIGDRLISDQYDSIDPTVLIDDDGQAYLYWGNPNLWYVKLKKNMTSISGTPQKCNVQYSDELRAKFKGQSLGENRFAYQEGPWAYKRDGIYYMAYASECCPEGIGYATSTSPVGPWECRGMVMDRDGRSSGNHPGIVDFKGQTYVFGFNYYINGIDGSSHRERRSVAVTTISFRDDGTIPTRPFWYDLPATQPVATLDPYIRQEAETIYWCEGVRTAPYTQRGICVDSVQHGGFIQVANVDFGSGATSLSIEAKANKTAATIQVFADNMYENLPIATVHITETGRFSLYEIPVTDTPTGIHDLYFLFTSDTDVHTNLMAVDYWQFHPTDTPEAVISISSDSPNSGIYYTPAGIPTRQPIGHGIYIQDGRKTIDFRR